MDSGSPNREIISDVGGMLPMSTWMKTIMDSTVVMARLTLAPLSGGMANANIPMTMSRPMGKARW